MTDRTAHHPLDEGPDAELDALARRIAAPVRAHTESDPDAGFEAAVLAAVRADALGDSARSRTHTESESGITIARAPSRSRFWAARWRVDITPLRLLAAAASLMLVVATARMWFPGGDSPNARIDRNTAAAAFAADDSVTRVVRFELRAPASARVSLVGAFNGWEVGQTPLVRVQDAPDRDGLVAFVISVSLARGYHEYAFVLDDSTWVPDPNGTSYVDEFGARTSRMIVDGTPSNGA